MVSWGMAAMVKIKASCPCGKPLCSKEKEHKELARIIEEDAGMLERLKNE